MIRSYDELHPDCSFSLEVAGDFPDLRGELAITCYRLVQEALSNVVKHAGATRAAVRLARHESLPLLLIDVADDGRGFDPAMPMHDRLGLVGMRERVSAAGGSISIESAPDEGTTLSIRLPLPVD